MLLRWARCCAGGNERRKEIKAMVVSFSGIDGAGKTTQITRLEEYCNQHGIEYTKKWSKARGTPGVMLLKEFVRRDKKLDTEKKLEYREKVYQNGWKRKLLLTASLLDLCWYWGFYFRILKRKCPLLILDRYIWDTYVEVSTEFGIDNLKDRPLWKLVKAVALKPDRGIILTIPAEESLRRDTLKGEITTDSLEFKKRKIAIYHMLMEKKCWNVVLDATATVEQTFSEICRAIHLQEGKTE